MATCKDCLHLEACRQWYTALPDKYHDGCEHFKARSAFMELPCNLGDPVYIIANLKNGNPSHIMEQKCTGIHITEKVFKHRAEKAHRYLVVRSDIGFAQHVPFTEFNKTVFFTRKKAETAMQQHRKDDT